MYRILISLMLFTTVATAEDVPITEYIASLPWAESYITQPQDKDKPDFIITISYKREGVISDKEIIPLKLYPLRVKSSSGQVQLCPGSSLPHRFKCRDSYGTIKWCNGTANLIDAKQNGFKIEIDLAWGGVIPPDSFKESFDCVWKTKQEFTKNGFRIIVETAKYNAEPAASAYGPRRKLAAAEP